jgi:hypothetical protein
VTDAPFTAETFQNEYLPAGADIVDAVVTVSAAGDPASVGASTVSAGDRAEVIVIDVSGSMGAGRKLPAAKAAAKAAVDCLDDGTQFAVMTGANGPMMAWPVDGTAFSVADATSRHAAKAAIDTLRAEGGTAIGSWLLATRDLFAHVESSARHAILLTDGRNETEKPEFLDQAIEACRGIFQCDCRGVGVDWDVEELRSIATVLLGTVDIVADPEDLVADFEAIMASSQSKTVPEVKLRLWAPQGAQLESFRQVAPEVVDLSGTGVASGPLTKDFLLGGWAPGEVRDYHFRIKVAPGGVGDEMLAGRVSLVLVDGMVATQALVRAVWTDDRELATQINGHVAHYTGQVELAAAIHEGLAAAKSGDERTATVKLGRAVQLAQESGHGDTLKLLREVVDVEDAEAGTVKLKRDVGKANEMTLDTRSTRTVRLGKPPAKP